MRLPVRLSIVVIVHDMPRQALTTIRSLSPAHQLGARTSDYEIVVVENRSANVLDPDRVRAAAPNARYLLRDEPGRSPAAAVNAGVRVARGRAVAVMVDGARMVTPGVVCNLLRAQRLGRNTVASVPGYHLGDTLQYEAVRAGWTQEQEQELLATLDWQQYGYRLFRRAVLSASCEQGYLRPLGESNCVTLPKRLFQHLGGFDERFTTPGGGLVNLDFYRRAVDVAGRLVVLPGEGTFHQLHGGATTGASGVDRDALLDEMRAEYERLRGAVHAPPRAAPILLGEIPADALPFLAHSVARAQR